MSEALEEAIRREDERNAFEHDAEQYCFDLKRCDSQSPEPWTEYKSDATGHRWAGWLAAKGMA